MRERHVREAFDALFHAVRIASMVYLSTEVGDGRASEGDLRSPTGLLSIISWRCFT